MKAEKSMAGSNHNQSSGKKKSKQRREMKVCFLKSKSFSK